MRAFAARVQLVVAVFAVAMALALGVSGVTIPRSTAAQKEKEKEDTRLPAGTKIDLVGASVCKKCHDETNPMRFDEYKETLGFEFVWLGENQIWGQHDLHSTATKNLLTNRTAKGDEKPNLTAQMMENNLRRISDSEKYNEKYTVYRDAGCLVCHASTRAPIESFHPAKRPDDLFIPEESLVTEGIGCEMCHGHGSAYRDKHQVSRIDRDHAPPGAIRVVPWRKWYPDDKQKWGLVNLRNPVEATRRCASCHVGNKEEGRFVTHEMFAAGHPPLPPLDLEAYAREQPRHWGRPSQMRYFASLAPVESWAVFHYRQGEQAATRRFAESSIASLRASLALIGQLAADAKEKTGGLDFAAFDCYSCHHDLKYPSDRQARGYDGPPGRPLFRLAPFALARLVVEHAAETDGGKELFKDERNKLDAIQKDLAFSFGSHTLGNPEAILKVLERANVWCATTLKNLEKVSYSSEETKKLLSKVIEAARREPVPDPRAVPALGRPVADPEVAQVYHWAITTLTLDLHPLPADPRKTQELTPELVQLEAELEKIVVTRLRPATKETLQLQPVTERLGERMKTFNNFRGDAFRDAFKKFKSSD